nr:tellurite resistance TerB C-terminal domain-containing protein [uncultured Flavobacterium sp.]
MDTTETVSEITKDDSVIDAKDEIVIKSISTDVISSITIENTHKEIRSVIQSLTDSKHMDTIEQVSEILKDDSVIDVTDETYIIKSDSDLIKYEPGVPYWQHQYVYSFSELKKATPSQKQFYFYFKNSFITGRYYDLEGNSNYCFILLFNLLDEYDNHKSITLLEKNLDIIGTYYPKTKSYAESFLRAKKNVNINDTETSRFTEKERYSYHNSFIDYDTFNWRNKYKKSLNLSEDDITLLNKIWYPSNNFTNIEFCCNEVIKLYIKTISLLKEKIKTEGTTFEEELINIADIIARKHYRYRTGSQNYKYSIDPSVTELYNTIFKYCENYVRDAYGHKRKLNTALKYSHDEIKTAFENKIVLKLDTILATLTASITPPDEATELQLNTQNTTRWKSIFVEITTNFSGTAEEFIEEMVVLGNANKKNPSVENIFFEASKFIAKQNKEAALKLYVYYLYYDLKSTTFDNKQLTKTVQKNLFDTNEQLQNFEQIISELINDRNLDKALNAVTNVYARKRKKIQLDRTTIKEVQQLHSGTVELLNEYLRDDFEDDNNTIKAEEISTEEIKLEITSKTKETEQSIYLTDLSFNATHIAVLELFTKNSLSILQSEMEAFAKGNGIFKNQIIDHINEICYETLDDVLIEEDDDYYTILPEYFNQIRNDDK